MKLMSPFLLLRDCSPPYVKFSLSSFNNDGSKCHLQMHYNLTLRHQTIKQISASLAEKAKLLQDILTKENMWSCKQQRGENI